MGEHRLRDALGQGEALRFETPLRTGGRLGITDDRVIITRSGGVEDVPLENVKEVTIQSIDWFLVVLSGALAVVGLYGALEVGDALLGGGFVTAAAVNLALTYRKRGRLGLRLHTGGNPIVAYVDDTEDVRRALKHAIESFEATRTDQRPG